MIKKQNKRDIRLEKEEFSHALEAVLLGYRWKSFYRIVSTTGIEAIRYGLKKYLYKIEPGFIRLLLEQAEALSGGEYHEIGLRLIDVCEQGAELLKNKQLLGECLFNRAMILSRLGKLHDAIKTYNFANAIFTELSPNLSKDLYIAACQLSIAASYNQMGEWQQSLNGFYRARAIFEEVSNKDIMRSRLTATSKDELVAKCNINIAICYYNVGKLEMARKIHEHALELLKSSPVKRYKYWCNINLGVIYSKLGEYEHALKLLYESRRGFDSERMYPDIANTELLMATIFMKTGNYNQALQLCENARTVFETIKMKENVGNCELTKAKVYKLQDSIDEALQSYKNALNMVASTSTYLTWECEYGIGVCLWMKEDRRGAFINFQRALGHIERLRSNISFELQRRSFMEDKMLLYRDIIFLCLQINNDDAQKLRICPAKAESFKYTERAKSRTFCESLGLTEIKPPKALEEEHQDLLDQEKECLNKIMAFQIRQYQSTDESIFEYGDQLQEIEEKLNKLHDEIESISEESKEYVSLRRGRPLNLEGVKECLR